MNASKLDLEKSIRGSIMHKAAITLAILSFAFMSNYVWAGDEYVCQHCQWQCETIAQMAEHEHTHDPSSFFGVAKAFADEFKRNLSMGHEMHLETANEMEIDFNRQSVSFIYPNTNVKIAIKNVGSSLLLLAVSTKNMAGIKSLLKNPATLGNSAIINRQGKNALVIAEEILAGFSSEDEERRDWEKAVANIRLAYQSFPLNDANPRRVVSVEWYYPIADEEVISSLPIDAMIVGETLHHFHEINAIPRIKRSTKSTVKIRPLLNQEI